MAKSFLPDVGTLSTGLIYGCCFNGNSNDAVGTANGVDTSMTYSSGDGIIPQGGAFSGSGFITFSDAAFPSGNPTGLTISAWVKFSAQASNAYGILQYGSAAGNGGHFLLYINESTGAISVDFGGGGATSASSSNVGTGAFHNVIVTYDGTTLRYYIDNVAAGTSTTQVTPNIVLNSANIGSGSHGGAPNWVGSLDEIYVWSKVISATERSNLVNSGAGNTYISRGGTNTGGLIMTSLIT